MIWNKKILTKPRTKEKVSIKQFFKEVKQGMEKVTPLQQSIITLWGLVISIIGIIWGIIFSIRIGYKWMAVILVGGLIVALMQLLGTWQRKTILKRMEQANEQADSIELEGGN